jgi:hypothetical protein
MPWPFPAPFQDLEVTPDRFDRADQSASAQQGLAQKRTSPEICAVAQFPGRLTQEFQEFGVMVGFDVSRPAWPGPMSQRGHLVAQPLGFPVVEHRETDAQNLDHGLGRQTTQEQQYHGVEDLFAIGVSEFLLKGFAFSVSKAYHCSHQGFRFYCLCSDYKNSVKPCFSKDLCALI